MFAPNVLNIIAPGTVINPAGLAGEVAGLATVGLFRDNLLISDRAHVILEAHRTLDVLMDGDRPESLRVGSTGQGVGPAYSAKAARVGVRLGDLLHPRLRRERVSLAIDFANAILADRFGHPGYRVDDVLSELEPAIEALRPMIGDTASVMDAALSGDKKILLEGQLGVMRDLDWGAYPFVTSSYTTPAGIAAAAGVPPLFVSRVVGVVKAYTTSVGDGPLPTAATGADLEHLQSRGAERGATTGRLRRCGWLDLPAVAWACRIGGFTELAVTKLDVLDGLEGIPVCTSYMRNGQPVGQSDAAACDWDDLEPVYDRMAGWGTTVGARCYGDLPGEARGYVERLAEFSGCPTGLVSVGPERGATIECLLENRLG